jgi:hypothetical protein
MAVLVVVDVVIVMAAYQPVVQECGAQWRKELLPPLCTDDHNRAITVVLAKHRIAP